MMLLFAGPLEALFDWLVNILAWCYCSHSSIVLVGLMGIELGGLGGSYWIGSSLVSCSRSFWATLVRVFSVVPVSFKT